MQLRTIGISLVLASLGCAKAPEAYASAAPEPYPAVPPPPPSASPIGGTRYDFSDAPTVGDSPATAEADDYEGEVSLASESAPSSRRYRAPRSSTKSTGSGRAADRSAHAQREIASPAREESKQEAHRGGPEPADEKPELDVDARYIVYVASMHLSVFNLADALVRVEALPEIYGGYISSITTNQVVLRIPSPQLKAAMAELATFGVVEYRVLQAQEVTAEFVDLEGRIRALEETRTQLLALLGQARTVAEALEVRTALDRVNTELEVLRGRLRQLSNQIAYSTLTIQLSERGPFEPTPSSNDPFPWVDELGVEATEWK